MTKQLILSQPEVQEILSGQRTSILRLVRPADIRKGALGDYHQGSGLWIETATDNADHCGHVKDYSISPTWQLLPVYIGKYAPYKTGDILYVRETWRPVEGFIERFVGGEVACTDEYDGIEYKAGGIVWEDSFKEVDNEDCLSHIVRRSGWKSPLCMKKAHARIILEVSSVELIRNETDGRFYWDIKF